MPEKRSNIEVTISKFAGVLRKQGLKVDKIILFGSQARGDAKKDSDIDLLVVSADFANMPLYRRHEILGKAMAMVRQPIEPLACTPEEVQLEKLSKAGFLYDVLARQKTQEYQV